MLFQRFYKPQNLPLTSGKSYRKAVRAVIMKNGQILMLRTINGDYKFPGGGVKKDEEDTEALRREVMEETGFSLSQVGACLGRVLERKKDDFLEDTIFEMESLYFLCSVSGEQGDQALEGYELDLQFTPVWISLEEAISDNEKVLQKGEDLHFRWIERETDILKELRSLENREDMVTTVYFVRHAEPVHGHKEDRTRPLTVEGQEDSKKVTEFFKEKDVHAYYSSPYLRSKDTIRGSAEEKGMDIEEHFGLRERENGKIENTKEMIRKRWEDFHFHEDEGESLTMVQKRNLEAFTEILEKESGRTVVVGTHGTALSMILHHYNPDFQVEDFFRIIDFMPYIVKLTFQGDKLMDLSEEFYLQRIYKRF